LINPNLIDNERHKRNIERRKQKSDYKPYEDEEVDEYGMVSILISAFVNNSLFQPKKQSILSKYDDDAEEPKRETFRLDTAGGYDLDVEIQEMETKRKLMMANKKFESLGSTVYVPARNFYTEEEMLTFRKPKKKKDKTRKSRTLKAADFEAMDVETAEEKAAK
jgi:U4/U6.U5 tri-snRNP-associated protein 1